MADIGSSLDRLSNIHGVKLGTRYDEDPAGGFIGTREWIPPPGANAEESPWLGSYRGIGRARTKKAAIKLANNDLIRQLPSPDTDKSSTADWVNFLIRKCGNNVVLRGESTGSKLPQTWKFSVYVDGKTEPYGTSTWLRRRNAMRDALQRACHELGLINRPAPAQLSYTIELSDDEEEEEQVGSDQQEQDRNGVVDDNDRTSATNTVHSDNMIGGSIGRGYHGPQPAQDDYAGMFYYLSTRHKNITFKAESRGGSLNSSWQYDLFVDDGDTPVARSDWVSNHTAKIQALQRAFRSIGYEFATHHSQGSAQPIISNPVQEETTTRADLYSAAVGVKRRRSASPDITRHIGRAHDGLLGKRARSMSPTISTPNKIPRIGE